MPTYLHLVTEDTALTSWYNLDAPLELLNEFPSLIPSFRVTVFVLAGLRKIQDKTMPIFATKFEYSWFKIV